LAKLGHLEEGLGLGEKKKKTRKLLLRTISFF